MKEPGRTGLRAAKERGSDETGEIHWQERDQPAALCGATDLRRATRAEQDAYLAPWCFTCREAKRLDAD